MKTFLRHTLVAALLSSLSTVCLAQAKAPGATSPSVANAAPIEPVDFIVAVVNSEPITNSEVQIELKNALQQAQAQNAPPVDDKRLREQILENLIQKRTQLQLAKETGLRIDTPQIDQAERNIAQQNQLSIAQLHARLAQEGTTPAKFREQLREQLTLQRLREREVEPRVVVSELDIDQYLQAQQSPESVANQLINLGQILVAVPESASAQDTSRLQAKAQEALEKARSGEDFGQLVRTYGDPSTHGNAVAMGLRPPDRYPALFVQAVQGIKPGQLTGPVRSPAGFHVLKLLERVDPDLPPSVIAQSLSRHILLRPSQQIGESQALERLRDFKRRIAQGSATFSGLAREFSQDGSASQGGDLGWASPGMFVPEFEDVMNRLSPGEISEPFVSRFGVHLLQLLERREQALSDQQIRQSIRSMLRQQKLAEAYQSWARDLRDRAYVDIRQAPQ